MITDLLVHRLAHLPARRQFHWPVHRPTLYVIAISRMTFHCWISRLPVLDMIISLLIGHHVLPRHLHCYYCIPRNLSFLKTTLFRKFSVQVVTTTSL